MAFAQLSPPAETSVTINGRKIAVNYSAPSVRGRKIFGQGGVISRDPTYPVWRAGANDATVFHSDADLDVNGLRVPKGDYTLWVLPEASQWKLIVNKQTGQWGLEYHQDRDLGRVPMTIRKPPKPVETLKITLSDSSKADAAWQRFLHITLPMMRNIIAITVLFSLIVTFANFDIVQIMTAGGPRNMTHVFATYAFMLGIRSGDLPLGAATSLFMFPILGIAAIFILRGVRKRGREIG